jgi:precorrin-6B methylase 2
MDSMLMAEIIFLYGLFGAGLLYLVFGGFLYGAMWMPLPKRRVRRMLEIAELAPGKVVYDLGAGFGNVAFQAAQNPSVKVIAVEADPFKAWWITRRIKAKKLHNVFCVKSNLLNIDLSKADVLLCYLSDSLMDKIAKKNMKETTLVISACHKIRGLKPKFIDRDGIYPIYLY